MKKNILCMILMSLTMILILSGCAEKECKLNSDCPQKDCYTATCVDNMCDQKRIPNCCGNGICDSTESFCSCQKDCMTEPCEGKIEVGKDWKGNPVQSEFLEHMCKDDACVVDFDRSKQREIPLVFENDLNYFTLETNINLKKPFDIDEDLINAELTLKDAKGEVELPIKIYEAQLISGSTLLGKAEVNQELKELREKIQFQIPVQYEPENQESKQDIQLKIFYTFEFQYRDSVQSRNADFQIKIKEPIYLIKLGELQ